jgi:hypothetical protein
MAVQLDLGQRVVGVQRIHLEGQYMDRWRGRTPSRR